MTLKQSGFFWELFLEHLLPDVLQNLGAVVVAITVDGRNPASVSRSFIHVYSHYLQGLTQYLLY